MAERFAPGDFDQLHQFVAASVWDGAPLETQLLVQADQFVVTGQDRELPDTGVTDARPWLSAGNCQLDGGALVGCKFVVARGDTPTLLVLVEEPLDEIARAIQLRAKAIGSFRLRFGGIGVKTRGFPFIGLA